MTVEVSSVAFQGVEVIPVTVQVQMASGMPRFSIVGLPDKAVAESRERVRAALTALGLSLPPKRITVNLSPADLLKEGSHFDLPIALGLLLALEVLLPDALIRHLALGELGLDGRLSPVCGALPAAMAAEGRDMGLICPAANGGEAAWSGNKAILAPNSLLALINHFKGVQLMEAPAPDSGPPEAPAPDLADVKGQESAKRALEIAAAGGHNLLMIGPPGSGKSMLASRLPGILPPMDAAEALELSVIRSVAGVMGEGGIQRRRPFADPHHSASVPALVGGGQKARPGEISLAHNGVLFLDELPEFNRLALEALRQPLETGRAVVSRANSHVTYPARVQLVAAMNPCRCGHLDDAEIACGRAPRCAADYQSRISGPLWDRIDLHVAVPALGPLELDRPAPAEPSRVVAARVARARQLQTERYRRIGGAEAPRSNSEADGKLLEQVATPDGEGRRLLVEATRRLKLSARGYHRVLRVARTLADLAGDEAVRRGHVAEALSYRRGPRG